MAGDTGFELAQVHGPGAAQLVGLDLPVIRATTIGDRNLFAEATISLNEAGT